MQPVQAITDDDKELIRQWCINFASIEPQSVDTVLTYWNKNKKKLFKGFGNKLRISFPVHEKISSTYRQSKWRSLYSPLLVFDEKDVLDFKVDPRNHIFINKLGEWLKVKTEAQEIYLRDTKSLCEYTKYCYIESGKTNIDKVFCNNEDKELKIPAGTKIMRAIRKVLEFYHFPNIPAFNKWRDEISVINTDREINAELVFSIHPIDFITMSDNKSGWTSCMSWIEKGGYSTGTIEMMNSNMALVVYLQNPNKFIYNDLEIPNKSWRTLVFVNKDIMIVGKHYPYQSEALAKIILDKLQSILYLTLGWNYQYKNQLYRDMVHSYVNSYIRNEFCRFKYGDSHKIYTYMNVMYHDMLEDHNTDYWCCRNYVPHNKYYNLSGRATCLCCGQPIADFKKKSWYTDDSINPFIKYCDDCYEKYHCCHCDNLSVTDAHYLISVDWNWNGCYKKVQICEHCLCNKYYYNIESDTFISKPLPYNNNLQKLTRERIKDLEVCGTIYKL